MIRDLSYLRPSERGAIGCMSARRASKSAAISAPTAGYFAWYEADVEVYTDNTFGTLATAGSTVAGWRDQNAHTHDATRITASTGGVYRTATGPNSKPYVEFTWTTALTKQFVVTANFASTPQPFDMFFVVRQRTNNGDGTHSIAALGDNVEVLTQFPSSPRMYLYAGSILNEPGNLALNTWGIVQVTLNGASSQIKTNALTPTSGAAGALAGITYLKLGCGPSNNTGANVDIAEAIFYSSALSAGDSTVVRNYLNSKYVIF